MSKQRIVLVTGGGTGIGKATVELFANNGDIVYAAGRREQPLQTLQQKYPKNVRALQLDITDPASVQEAVQVIYKAGQGLDVLVNCAGSSGHVDPNQSLAKALKQWSSVISTNLNGAFLVTYALLPLLATPGGRIVHVTSSAAFAGSSRLGGEAYAAAKAGIHGMMRTQVRQLAPKGVTVNCVSPGFTVETDFFGGAPVSQDRIQSALPTIPAGRIGKPEDSAAAIFFLASKQAGYINGDIVNVNGGQQFGR
jgi:3-oxoacyl-[acyl-carrier protein] reductase